ncbi:hypothetical protein GO730_22965 [Spirosoma sp. HMF3257]|uniref:Uma2 family endonuclease n=1 Tax=Spirosoma telluris TaxID=2183553 RepID=A0A327NNC1_9BACT|nr:hypothetical protein [Spirosoma telluris]RAI76313.1 hypothetical protein HMF3257_22910 [Spirosoma telluris]
MYEQKYNPPFLVHDDGTNSPLDHQLVISKLTCELGLLYYHKQAISLIPLPETPLNEGPGHAVPDVVLYDLAAEDTKIIIEVCQTNGQRNDLRKIINLIEDNDYGILEGFVYNYKTHEWLRYRKGDGGAASASSFSEVMGVDLGPML